MVSLVHNEKNEECVCVACGAQGDFSLIVRYPWIALFRCPACGSATSLPRPNQSEQLARHDSADYFEHPYFQERRVDLDRVGRRARLALDRVGRVIDLSSLRGARYLDVGCDTGAFALEIAKQTGVRPEGIDIARRAVAEAVRNGLPAYCTPLEAAGEDLSDLAIVTATDVIEHLVDPLGFLCDVKRRLRDGGVIYVETPNIGSAVYGAGLLASRITGGRPRPIFERLFPPEHVQYFSRDGLKRAAEMAGLQLMF